MGKVYASLEEVREFLEQQRVFFVATAPSSSDGHVNLSPKGLDAFRVLGPMLAAYVDYPGSGIETVAHLRENGRIVLMFCAFEGPPRIMRIWGRGAVIEPEAPEFAQLMPNFSVKLTVRSIIRVSVERVADSCGYAVPLFEYRGERDQLIRWAARKGDSGLLSYMKEKNAQSVDGLPGLPSLVQASTKR